MSYVVDIAEEDAVEEAVRTVVETAGRLDSTVSSTGIIGPSSAELTSYAVTACDAVYRINLRGDFLMTKWAINEMEVNNCGRILHLASIAGKEGNPFMAGYSSIKAGVIDLV